MQYAHVFHLCKCIWVLVSCYDEGVGLGLSPHSCRSAHSWDVVFGLTNVLCGWRYLDWFRWDFLVYFSCCTQTFEWFWRIYSVLVSLVVGVGDNFCVCIILFCGCLIVGVDVEVKIWNRLCWSYLYVFGYLGLLWFLISTCAQSCDLGISNNTAFAVCKNKMLWLSFFYLVYSGCDCVWHWYRIPSPSGNIIFQVNTHNLESTLGVSTWTKAYCGFFPSSLAIYWCVLLMDVSVLANI